MFTSRKVKISKDDAVIHDLIDLTAVPSRDELQDEEAVWRFDLESGEVKGTEHPLSQDDINSSVCTSPYAALRKHTEHLGAIKPLNTMLAVEDMLHKMCEGGENMVCGPAGSIDETSLNRNDITYSIVYCQYDNRFGITQYC
jgi:hypothetical protein